MIRLLQAEDLTNSVRLGILLALYYVDGYVTFATLVRSVGLSKSTVHGHLEALASRGLVESRKAITIAGVRRVIRLTQKGRQIVEKYLEIVEELKREYRR
ncbi:MAG: transcriptional regulator [Pyrobaculum sp.]